MDKNSDKPESQQTDAAKKRWVKINPSERKALASQAAHARWKDKGIEVADSRGTVVLGGFELACAVLANGQRVISERSFNDALGRHRHPADYSAKREAALQGKPTLPSYLGDDRIAQFLTPDAKKKLASPIRFQVQKGFGIPALGLEATLIGDVCDAYIAAQQAGVLRDDEQAIAARSLSLIRALAKVAIVALIDEATGYQVKRSRDELQQLLAQYVSEEHRPWSKIFPDEFYIELFRLRNLKLEAVRKRPSYFGHLTNDIVYKRLVPGILPKLDEVNPANEKGRRKHTHTQHLTNSIGETHLRSHLSGVIMLMKASTSYEEFVRQLDKAAPKQVADADTTGESLDDDLDN
jgi:hypothetical protein